MSITILCPNGHKLVCPESQAGKRGKCPHCQATFRVPLLEEAAGEAAGHKSSPAVSTGSAPALAGVAVATTESGTNKLSAPETNVVPPPPPGGEEYKLAAVPVPPPPPTQANLILPYDDSHPVADDEILFLCPNGHRLCGPTSLGGRPGECPTCHAKFLVPSEEDLAELEEPPADEGKFSFNFEAQGKTAPDNTNGAAPVVEQSSLVALFNDLWAFRQQGARVELMFEDGKTVTPDGYAPHLSRHGVGMFMARDAGGTFTLIAVAWDTVKRISVRGIKQLPDGIFQ